MKQMRFTLTSLDFLEMDVVGSKEAEFLTRSPESEGWPPLPAPSLQPESHEVRGKWNHPVCASPPQQLRQMGMGPQECLKL